MKFGRELPAMLDKTDGGVMEVMQGQATKDETKIVKTKIPMVEETKNEDDVPREPELVASSGCLIRLNIPVLNSFQSLTMEASTSTGDPMGLHHHEISYVEC